MDLLKPRFFWKKTENLFTKIHFKNIALNFYAS